MESSEYFPNWECLLYIIQMYNALHVNVALERTFYKSYCISLKFKVINERSLTMILIRTITSCCLIFLNKTFKLVRFTDVLNITITDMQFKQKTIFINHRMSKFGTTELNLFNFLFIHQRAEKFKSEKKINGWITQCIHESNQNNLRWHNTSSN